MSNFISYDNLAAVHPGCYVETYLEDFDLTAAEFAAQVGLPEETISDFVGGKIPVTRELAEKLSPALGVPVEMWFNLQARFERDLATVESRRRRTIRELFQGYDGVYKPVEVDWGKPEGREIW